MENAVEKAYEITDAKITFVSLVDRAANRKTFLLTKQADGSATFQTCGRIVRKDAETHYVTGIVYEPMAEDTHGNYMTESEIEKAAHWFAKNGNMVDLQHSFEPLESAAVVESWIAKADFEIEGQTVRKGTWLMTVEVCDEAVWAGIEKGDITGFSMGGIGTYSEEDVNLDNVSNSGEGVQKGAMAEAFAERGKWSLFWDAFNTLQTILCPYDPMTGVSSLEADERKIRESLKDFSAIVTDILASTEPIAKSLAENRPVEKSGRAMSQKNRETLTGIRDSLDAFLKSFDPEEDPEAGEEKAEDKETADGKEGEHTMTKQEVEAVVQESVRKAMEQYAPASGTTQTAGAAEPETAPIEKASNTDGGEMTEAGIRELVRSEVKKAMEPESAPEEPLTKGTAEAMIRKAVAEEMETLRKARGLPSNLGSAAEVEKKAEQHYLHGIL